MGINSLPDSLLKQIFSTFCLGELLRFHHVCSKWSLIQRAILFKVTNLTILTGNDEKHFLNEQFYTFDIPYLKDLSECQDMLVNYKISYKNSQFEFQWLNCFWAAFITKQLLNVKKLRISMQSTKQKITLEKNHGKTLNF